MKHIKHIAFIYFLLLYAIQGISQPLSLPEPLQGDIPFEMEALAKTPAFRWENQKGSVWSLLYEGEGFKGRQTEVFAYYASPSTLSEKKTKGEKYPAVVAIHGGGGTAFAIWVREWAEKGYAAIAMDLGGARPLPENEQLHPWATKSTPLVNGAPDDTDEHKFHSIDKDFSEHWQFHAVSNVIRAHSLIRSFSDTDTSRTALTGISWGGYLTNIVAGIDHRFKAAVPIYGCGFLQEKSAWLSRFDSLGLENSRKWIRLWEPSAYVGNARMPMLFVNGTNDFAYHVESWQKTIDLVPNAEQLLIFEMHHNHEKGAEPIEIEVFFHDVFQGERDTPLIGQPRKIGKWIVASLDNAEDLQESSFTFIKDVSGNKERKWKTVEAELIEGFLTIEFGHNIEAGYFHVVYDNGKRISSPIVFN